MTHIVPIAAIYRCISTISVDFLKKSPREQPLLVALVALFVVKCMKAFPRVLNTSSRLIAARYYAHRNTSVSQSLKCLYFGAARKTRQSNPLWILCGGAIIPSVSDSSFFLSQMPQMNIEPCLREHVSFRQFLKIIELLYPFIFRFPIK